MRTILTQADVALPALHRADARPVQPAPEREFILGNPQGVPQLAQAHAERFLQGDPALFLHDRPIPSPHDRPSGPGIGPTAFPAPGLGAIPRTRPPRRPAVRTSMQNGAEVCAIAQEGFALADVPPPRADRAGRRRKRKREAVPGPAPASHGAGLRRRVIEGGPATGTAAIRQPVHRRSRRASAPVRSAPTSERKAAGPPRSPGLRRRG